MVVAPEDAGPARRLAIGGVVAEGIFTQVMEWRLGMLADPYREDEAGRYSKLAKTCAAGGAALLVLRGKRSRLAAVAGGTLLLAGEAALRWSVFKAGFQSARDPKYTVIPQRDRAPTQNGA